MIDRISKFQGWFEIGFFILGIISLTLSCLEVDKLKNAFLVFGIIITFFAGIDLIFRLNLNWDKRKVKGLHFYQDLVEVTNTEVLDIIEDICKDARKDTKIFATSTFFTSHDYERDLFKAIKKISGYQKNSSNTNTIFMRIITNYHSDPKTRDWIDEFFDIGNTIYSDFRQLLAEHYVELFFYGAPIGIDMFIAQQNKSTKCIIGIKEEDYKGYYGPKDHTKLLAKGKTYYFEDDNFAKSMVDYFRYFLKPLSKNLYSRGDFYEQ